MTRWAPLAGASVGVVIAVWLTVTLPLSCPSLLGAAGTGIVVAALVAGGIAVMERVES